LAQDRGKGVSTGQSLGFSGRAVLDVTEVPGSRPTLFRVTLTVQLGGHIGLSASRNPQGGGGGLGVGVQGEASTETTAVFSQELPADRAAQYRAAVEGGSIGEFRELQVAKLAGEGRLEEARSLYAAMKGRQRTTAGILAMKPGSSAESSTATSLGGSAGVSTNRSTLGIEIGGSRTVQNGWRVSFDGRQYIVTNTLAGETGVSGGVSFSQGPAGMGVSHGKAESRGRSVSFVIDAADPDVQAKLDTVTGLTNVDDLARLARSRPDLGGSVTDSKGTRTTDTTSASLAGVSLTGSDVKHQSQSVTRDAQGRETHTYEGGTASGATLSAGSTPLVSDVTDESVQVNVGPDKKVSGATTATRTQTDFLKTAQSAAAHPSALLALAKGDTSVIQQRTDEQGKTLTNDSFAQLSALAEDPVAWGKAWEGNISTREDWMQARFAVKRANGDPDKIAQALSRFQGSGSGRSATVEKAIGDTGISFEFPDEIAGQKAEFDALVVGDPFGHARELAAQGNAADAKAELNALDNRLQSLMHQVQTHRDAFQSSARLQEVQSRISDRQKEIETQLHGLAPKPAVVAPAPQPAGPGQAAPPAQAVDAAQARPQAPDEDLAAKVEARNKKIDRLIPQFLTYQEQERSVFAEVNRRLESWNPFTDKTSTPFNMLNDLKASYVKWKEQLNELRQVYQERGEDPARANQYAPDENRWNEVNHRVLYPS
jgi:hypothetical protein